MSKQKEKELERAAKIAAHRQEAYDARAAHVAARLEAARLNQEYDSVYQAGLAQVCEWETIVKNGLDTDCAADGNEPGRRTAQSRAQGSAGVASSTSLGIRILIPASNSRPVLSWSGHSPSGCPSVPSGLNPIQAPSQSQKTSPHPLRGRVPASPHHRTDGATP